MSETKELTIIDRIKVFDRDGKQWTTSLNVAEVFGKEHFVVLKAIDNLDCSQVFRDNNFIVSSYITSQNKEMPMYDITRDGFMFLVMGFTCAKSAQLKEGWLKIYSPDVWSIYG